MNMIKKASSDWNFREKLVFTIFVLFLYRVGVMIPLPFVNSSIFSDAVTQSEIAGGLLSAATMVGGSLTQLGLFSLGVMPYITASIIFQLLKVAVPKLEELGQTDAGKKQISQWTRYLTVVLAISQAVGIVLGAPALLGVSVFTDQSAFAKILAIFTMTAGTILVMRMGEEITTKGISNGMSLIIFTSILSSIPGLMHEAVVSKGILSMIILLVILFSILAVVAYVEKCEYRVNVVYAKTSLRAANHNNIPVKLAIAGVLPVILSSVLISVPRIIDSYVQTPGMSWWMRYFGNGTIGYGVLFSLLTIAMTFFSILVVFNVQEIAKNIKSQGGFIAGKRPGDDTANFLSYIANKMAGLDAIYLVAIGLVPLYLFPLVGVPEMAFGATSIIILCTVIVTVLAVVDTERKTATLQESSFLYRNKKDTNKNWYKKLDGSNVGKTKEKERKGFLK